MSEVDDKFRLLFDFHPAAAFEPAAADHVLVVQADDDEVRLAACFTNLPQVFFDILGVAFRADVETIAQDVAFAAKFIFGVAGGADLGGRIKPVVNHALALGVEPKARADASERGKSVAVDDESNLVSEWIHARFSREIDA